MFRIVATGRVSNEPYKNAPTSGKKPFASVSIVSSSYGGTNPDGSAKYNSVFIECVGFDKTAEALGKLSKGDIITVVGEPEVNVYESKDGKTVGKLKCVVREWSKISSGGVGKVVATTEDDDVADVPTEEDDSPFG